MSAGKDRAPSKKKKALGRGLAALLGDDGLDAAGRPATEPRRGEKIIELPVESLEPNPFQPRRHYDPESLKALSDSIAEHGVLQPLVVRPAAAGYQIIAGERRFRACQMAGLATVPVVVRQATDEQALLLALLENLQREDLGVLEEAQAYHRLAHEFDLSHGEIAHGVGKDRSTVANTLRLLKLPAQVRELLGEGKLTAGHGRALLALDSEAKMRAAAEQVVARSLSVRATERLVKAMQGGQPAEPKAPSQAEVHLASLAEQLTRNLRVRVRIKPKPKGQGGRLTIDYGSDHDLERLLKLLG